MIGLGQWQTEVNTMFFRGRIIVVVTDVNGAYDLQLTLPDSDLQVPEINLTETHEEGNTLSAKATVAALPGKTIDINLTFEADYAHGTVKMPYIGTVKIDKAVKVG